MQKERSYKQSSYRMDCGYMDILCQFFNATCTISLLAWSLEDVKNFFYTMPKWNVISWNTMKLAYIQHE